MFRPEIDGKVYDNYENLPSGYYEAVLDYVEENGVYAYGCTVTASPKQLLFLLNEGYACNLTIRDAWIGFYN